MRRCWQRIFVACGNPGLRASRGWLIGMVLSALAGTAGAQSPQLKLEHISLNQGLSQNSVFCILQDSRGFLWFGTQDGLNRYDGYRFVVFRASSQDSFSLAGNLIYCLYETRDSTLWAGTAEGGLNRFDRRLQRFQRFLPQAGTNSLSDRTVRAIFEDHDGALWIGTERGGLNRLDRRDGTFTAWRHDPADPASLSHDHVRAILQDATGALWIGTHGGGLNRFDPATGRFSQFRHDPADPTSLSHNTVTCLAPADSGRLWVGTDRGLNRFDPQTGRFSRDLFGGDAPNDLSDLIITNLLESRQPGAGTDTGAWLWVATLDGLRRVDLRRGTVQRLRHDPADPQGLQTNNVLALCEDRSGLVWIGVEQGGINIFDRRRNLFETYTHRPFVANSLPPHPVRALLEVEAGDEATLWIGTLGGGLTQLSRRAGEFVHYLHEPDDPRSLSSDAVTALCLDAEQQLWIGTWGGGVNRMATVDGAIAFVRYRHQPQNANSLSSDIVQAVYAGRRGRRLWVGTNDGLDCLGLRDGTWRHWRHDPADARSLSHNSIQSNCLLEDRDGYLWVGTWQGLNRSVQPLPGAGSSLTAMQFQRYLHDPADSNSLSDNRVISLFEDTGSPQRVLWIGTHGGGLNRLQHERRADGREAIRIVRYGEAQGLPNSVIYGIAGDDRGRLWLSTNFGIACFDPVTETVLALDVRDGLHGNQFYWGAAHRNRRGEVFFGGRDGLTIFDPARIARNPQVPPVQLTDFLIFNQPVLPGAADSPLHAAISEARALTLSSQQSVFSFEFAALDFTVPAKNRYAYKMEGFDRDWIQAGERRFATYTNLDQGRYVFRVIASNSDGVWNRDGVALPIRILPPFWKTWWFLLLAIFTIVGVAIYIVTAQVRQLLAVERLRSKLAADLHDDIGASLTEISILSEVVSRAVGAERPELHSHLQTISERARELVDRMSDIVWLVNPKRDSLYDLMLRLRDAYAELMAHKNIAFRSENLKPLEKVSLPMEHRQQLYLLFKEAINNSLKHSGCREIAFDAHVQGRHLTLKLADDGAGFSLAASNGGNGLHNMQARARRIGGEVRIASAPGAGTQVIFTGKLD